MILATGSLSIALAASGLALAAATTVATVQETLEAGWRGTYDILVRSTDARSIDLGDGERIVPSNYATTAGGGITRAQWQAISAIPGIEVAVPVAALGWMKSDDVGVGTELALPAPEQVLRIDVEVTVSGSPAISRTAFFATGQDPLASPTLALGIDSSVVADRLLLSVGTLPPIWGMVVGIDPEEEDDLIGLFGYADGDYLEPGVSTIEDVVYGSEAIAVPVLVAPSIPIPGSVSVTVAQVEGASVVELADAAQMAARDAAGTGGPSQENLVALVEGLTATDPLLPMVAGHAELADLVQPFQSAPVSLVGAGTLARAPGGGLLNAGGRNVVLVPQPSEYGVSQGRLTLALIGEWSSLVEPAIDRLQPPGFAPSAATFGGDTRVYRPMKVTRPSPFVLRPIGSYDLERLSTAFRDAANYVPLGIYDDESPLLVSNTAGMDVNEELPTSLNPAGLNPLPPIGLTNLEAVEALRGPRFIDAIRVRVANIEGYSPAAVARIEDVAGAIIGRTGLHVDVVAGSSPIDVPVDVPGVGAITERWTTLGAAPRIESAITGFSGVLLAASAAVVLVYLLMFGLFLVEDQSGDLEPLRLIGWRRRQITELLMAQAALIGILAASVSILLTFGISLATGTQLPVAAWVTLPLAIVAAHLLAAASVAAILALRHNDAGVRGRHVGPRRLDVTSVARLAIVQASESSWRLAGVALALVTGLALAGSVVLLQVAFGGRLAATVLGQVVAVRIGPYHVLAVAAALLAAGAMVIDTSLLSVERRVATIGLLRAVGWRARAVQRAVLVEAAIPSLAAGLLAAGVLTSLGWWADTLWLGVGLGVLAIMLAVAIGTLAGIPAAQLAVGVTPAITLRAEGVTASVRGLSLRTALVTVGVLMIMTLAGALAWSAAAPLGIPSNAFVRPATAAPPSAVENRIEADVTALSGQPDRVGGSTGLAAAQKYASSQLIAAGYEVHGIDLLARQPHFIDASGRLLDDEALAGIVPVALAYGQSTFDGVDLHSRLTFLDASQTSAADAPCPPGIGLIRIADDGGAGEAAQLVGRCRGQTLAILAVRTFEAESWSRLMGSAVSVSLPAVKHLLAETPSAGPDTPWLVATIDSLGPGATQSSAPVAVALELARRASTGGPPVRIALAVEGGASSVALVRQIMQTEPDASVIVLGPLGGAAEISLGTIRIAGEVDVESTRAGLLATTAIDGDVSTWLDHVMDVELKPTESRLLDVLAGCTGISAGTELGLNAYFLAVGVDAAYLGESVIGGGGAGSVAGSSIDTPDHVDPARLTAIVADLACALDLISD